MRALVPRDAGSYSYAGMGYANPHAVTGVGYTGGATMTYVYDNNGNLTSASGRGYTWDYRNRLTAAGAGGATTTYAYDHENQRVQKVTSSSTTTYVNRYYNIASTSSNATATKHIFTPSGELIATVVGTSSAATTTYLHPDHLGGTNVVTDGSGNSVQVLDYYPYGSQRIASGSFSEQRRFIGEEYDAETEFSYLNARYYQGSRGQFMSQDPLFLHIGDPQKVKEMTRKALLAILADPQASNSYSYARNNPLVYVDSTGKWYVQIGATFAIGPFSAGYGVRFNNQGAVTYYSAGAGFGLMADIGVEFNSGDIDVEKSELTISHDAAFAGGPSINTSYESRFDPKNPLQVGPNGTRSFGIGAGIGGRINQTYTQSIPVFRFGPDVYTCTNCSPSSNNAGGRTDASNRSYVGPNGATVDVWAIVQAAVSHYYAEGGK